MIGTIMELLLVALLHLYALLMSGAILFHIVRDRTLTFLFLPLVAVLFMSGYFFGSTSWFGTARRTPRKGPHQ